MIFRMKFRFIFCTVFAVLMGFVASAQYRKDVSYMELYDSETVISLRNHIRALSSVQNEGRPAGGPGEIDAASYVERTMADYGVDIVSAKGGDIFGIRKENGDTLTSRNVIGFVQGYDKSMRDKYIVIGARLDNLPPDLVTVDGQQVNKIYPGANGNASGLAMMMELARMVQTNKILFRRSVLFVAFGASLETHAGAWYFLNRSFADADKIEAMINLDMLGTGSRGFYAYTGSNADLNIIINSLSGELQPINPQLTAAEPYPSDHRVFHAKEIPAVFLTTGHYSEHNTSRDTESIIEYDMMERELEYIYNLTIAIANTSVSLAFKKDETPSRTRQYADIVPYYDCDQKPMFLNSTDPTQFLTKWVYKYLKYPPEAVRDGIQGRVMVEFVINKDGSVSNVRVVRGVSEELDAEAVKVVAASPKWKPARLKGAKVRSSMTIPIEFRLEKKGRPSFGIKK